MVTGEEAVPVGADGLVPVQVVGAPHPATIVAVPGPG